MKLDEKDPEVNKKHDQKSEKLIFSALAHNDAEVRFEPSSKAADRSLVFGSDHRVIKAASLVGPPEGYIVAGDFDDEDNLFGDDDEDDIVQTRMTSNGEINEARRDVILGSVTTETWHRAKERPNKQ